MSGGVRDEELAALCEAGQYMAKERLGVSRRLCVFTSGERGQT